MLIARVGGALATVTVGVLAAVALALVATVKLKFAVAVALNVTLTVPPALMPLGQLTELSVITNPLVVLAVAPVV